MASFGGFGKFPFKFGGEPSHQEKAYKALRSMVGEGGSPPQDPLGETTFDGIWRRAKANGLGALASFGEAAIYQGFPTTVTDELKSYEEIVGMYLPAKASEEDRRIAVTQRWVAPLESGYPAFTDALKALDARFSILTPPHANTRYTHEGKVFETPGGHHFDGGRDNSKFPNFADEHVVAVLLDVGEGVGPVGKIGETKNRAETLLGNALPAWNDFVVMLDVGFTLDVSLLDVTGFAQ